MKIRLPARLKSAPAKNARVVTIIAISALIIGAALLVYQVGTTQELQGQKGQLVSAYSLSSNLRANSFKNVPIPSSGGSWLEINLLANKTVSLTVGSSLTGTIFNYTNSTMKDIIVSLPNSTNYNVTTWNYGTSTAFVTGNANLTILSLTTQTVQIMKYPFRTIGGALASAGAITLIYFALPGEPNRKRSLELLFQ